MDHMGPELIVEEQVQKDVIPPLMVCSRLILSLLADFMEGVLGDLSNSPQCFSKQKRRGELPCTLMGNVPTQMTGC